MQFVTLSTGGRTEIPLAQEPTRVWRWSVVSEPPKKADALYLQSMDRGHDWHWREGKLRYTFSDRSDAWIVIQYGSTPASCPSCGATHDPQHRYCMECGGRLLLSVSAISAAP